MSVRTAPSPAAARSSSCPIGRDDPEAGSHRFGERVRRGLPGIRVSPASTASSSSSASTVPSGETSAASHASTGHPGPRSAPSVAEWTVGGEPPGQRIREAPHEGAEGLAGWLRRWIACAGILSARRARPRPRNDAGSAHTSASIRPRSAPSMSGRQRARHPSAVSSSAGSTRPRVVSSRDHVRRPGSESEVSGEGDTG